MNLVLVVGLGLLIGLALGSLGGGGSILAVPVLAHIAGQSAAAATATSLVAVGVASAAAVVGHARAHHVRWGAAAAFVVAGVPGSWAGAELNHRLDGDVLLLVFSGLVLVAAHRMLTACPSCTRIGEDEAVAADSGPPAAPGTGPPEPPDGPAAEGTGPGRTATALRSAAGGTGGTPASLRRAGPVVAAGLGVGLLTGLFGVGGGFVIVPALTLALGLSMPMAIGTSLAVIVGNAVVALGFRGLGAVEWNVAVPFTVTMLIGSVAGAAVAHRLPPRKSLHAFAVLLVVVAIGNAALAIAGL